MNNLECVDPVLCRLRPWAYGWADAHARGRCSDLGEGGSSRPVDDAVANPVAPMLLAASYPHDKVSINVIGGWIVVRAMDLPCRLRVGGDLVVDARVGVRLGRVVHAEGDVRRRRALVGHAIRGKQGARLSPVCRRLRER
jgi:hypothetical protein